MQEVTMNIVILDGAVLNPGDNPWTPMEAMGKVTVFDRTPPELVVERARNAEAIFTNKTRLSADMLKELPKLRYIGVLATGYDVVDIAAAGTRGIPVCNVMAYGVDAVAQHVMALLLELTRSVSPHSDSVRAGQWTRATDWCYWLHPLRDLTDMTMGVLGLGNIGRRVAELAHAFGMRVQGWNRSPISVPEYITLVDKDALFATSDVVSLHVPLSDDTRGLVNARRLASMKPGSLLINTARGPLLDEAAVAAALTSGHLGGLGADVLAQEPPAPDNPLLTAPRCLITPHISWATLRARRNTTRLAAENLRAWLDGSPRNVVNAVHMS